MVARQACDLVVLDLVMPEMEGAETVMELRRLRPSLPVLAISGVVGADFYLQAARLLGAGATLRKPFTARDLLGHVDALLARSN
jgi:DNA-binding response OmpR family regulator